jgi:succinoglycan biosynthesis protein ExoV
MGEALNIPPEYLDNHEPRSKWIVVFGSGAGYYDPPVIDSRWRIYCVRGPLTAELMGLDARTAVADPAILIRRLYTPRQRKIYKYSLMPHHSNAGAILRTICEDADIHYIDPLDPIDSILDSISSSETLLTEALHGSIVADALRTPWVPIQTDTTIFAFKWQDWCKSIAKEYKPLVTSEILNRIWSPQSKPSLSARIKQNIKFKLAERNLRGITKTASPVLSDDSVIESLTNELERRLDAFKRDFASRVFD